VRKSPSFDADKTEAPGKKIGARKIRGVYPFFLAPIFCPMAETTTDADKKRLFAADHSF
jgi:hypothetical protein